MTHVGIQFRTPIHFKTPIQAKFLSWLLLKERTSLAPGRPMNGRSVQVPSSIGISVLLPGSEDLLVGCLIVLSGSRVPHARCLSGPGIPLAGCFFHLVGFWRPARWLFDTFFESCYTQISTLFYQPSTATCLAVSCALIVFMHLSENFIFLVREATFEQVILVFNLGSFSMQTTFGCHIFKNLLALQLQFLGNLFPT